MEKLYLMEGERADYQASVLCGGFSLHLSWGRPSGESPEFSLRVVNVGKYVSRQKHRDTVEIMSVYKRGGGNLLYVLRKQ